MARGRVRARLLVLPLLTLGLAVSSPAANQPSLSAEQRRQLARGEVVVLDVLPPGGDARTSSMGGTAMALIHAAPPDVWRVLVDYRHHSGLYPRVVDAEVVEVSAQRILVRYVLGVGPFAFGFHVNNYPEQARGHLAWRLAHDRPNDLFRDSWGYWQLDDDPRGTIVTYAMAARTALPAFLTRGADRDGLVATLRAVRARAEQAG